MTKMMAANCDKGTPSDVTVVFPGQSQSSSGITVLCGTGSTGQEHETEDKTPTLFDVS
jgi:hypothetical protein